MSQTTIDTRTDLPPWVAGVEHRMHELDPELTDEQLKVVGSYGKELILDDGEMLWSAGQRDTGFFVVLDGHIEIVDKAGSQEERVIITHGRGHYGGEVATISGRGALVAGRAKGQTRVHSLTTTQLQQLLALESELGEILLTSFVVRRMRMLAENHGEVILYGVAEEAATAKIATFLGRQGVPFELRETTTSHDIPETIDCELDGMPVLAIGGELLCRPTIRNIAETLGISAELESGRTYDVAVIGGGPSGLASAVYAASEGLNVLVIEALVPGGQAGTSSRIENYLGFPTGISGQGLAGRAFLQASKFGAEIAVAREVERLECGVPHILHLDGGDWIEASAVVIASGAIYREPPIENLDRFTGGGVHYGASYREAQLCRGKDIAIIGGGNSAGQAAIYLSDYVSSIKIIVRDDGLSSTMSSYLVDRIDRARNIEILPHTEVRSAHGDMKLRSVEIDNNQSDTTQQLEIAHLFVFIGAVPATDFVPDEVALDAQGFILTGHRPADETRAHHAWLLERPPFPLESSCPGVFAVGDVRSGSVKRVASAVGEGSVCIQSVHQVLAER